MVAKGYQSHIYKNGFLLFRAILSTFSFEVPKKWQKRKMLLFNKLVGYQKALNFMLNSHPLNKF
jgi:hypothetical protein